jgi:endonuclease YncB( thermonuclease family)
MGRAARGLLRPSPLPLVLSASGLLIGGLCLMLVEDSRGRDGSAFGAELAGTVQVIDGDTIGLAGARIRLWGIDAPERGQTCRGKNGDNYECGRDAAAVLLELTRGRRVECAQRDTDRYGRVVAVCRTENGELNAVMVRRGWAVDYTKYSRGRYRSEEEQARREQLGMWAGRFEMPWEWRHRYQ